MKKLLKFIIIFSCICFQNLNAQREVSSKSEPQKFTQQQVDSLNAYVKQLQKVAGKDLKTAEICFFNALPNSFEEMATALYLDEKNALLDYEKNGKPLRSLLPHPWITSLVKLTTIPSESYYEKYINICINGSYGADNLRNGFHIYKHFETDTKRACRELAKRNDAEIESVFEFIFDSIHPKNEFNEALYAKIFPLIEKENKRLSRLFKKAYEVIMRKSHH